MTTIEQLMEIATQEFRPYPKVETLDLTDEQVAEFDRACDDAQRVNGNIAKARAEIMKEFLPLFFKWCTSTWDRKRSLTPKSSPWYPSRPHEASLLARRVKEHRDKIATEQRAKEYKQKADELNARAVMWLVERGLKAPEDFALENARKTARDIACEELVESRIANEKWFEFVGQNCGERSDTTCAGWDGKSHRCECGNRRVNWIYDGTHEEPYVYGEAY
jgi:hypothetical protein